MILLIAGIVGLLGGFVLGGPLAHVLNLGLYRQGLPPNFARAEALEQLMLWTGGILAVLTLVPSYAIRRIVIAPPVGFALAAMLISVMPLDPGQHWARRPDFFHAMGIFVSVALWYVFQPAAETRAVTVGMARTLQLVSVLCAVFALYWMWKLVDVGKVEGDLRLMALSPWGVLKQPLYRLVLGPGSLSALCWLARERLLESAPVPERALPMPGTENVPSWKRPRV